jgi:23S rRNA (uracil1939-C5)-methyltransferase
MHLSYANQIALKQRLLTEAFSNQQLAETLLFIASPRAFRFRYRTNVKLEDGIIGFSAKHSHQLVDIHDCRILSQGLVDRLPNLLKLGRNHCEFSLLASSQSADIAISVTENTHLVPLPGYPSSLQEDYGFGAITLNSDGFAQSNPFVTKLICTELLRHVRPADRVWDLYCGCGTFSIPLAQQVETLVGFDISKKSIATAAQNALASGLDNKKD